jgi:hypothetical protein
MAYIQTWLSDERDCRIFGHSLCYSKPCGDEGRATEETKLKKVGLQDLTPGPQKGGIPLFGKEGLGEIL